jgi:hypothetical protein
VIIRAGWGQLPATFLLVLLLIPTVGIASDFHSIAYGYHLYLPDGWVRIPPNVIQATLDVVQDPAAAPQVVYEAGFQLDSASNWLEYPYILVQPLPYGTRGQIDADDFEEAVRYIAGLDLVDELDGSLSHVGKELVDLNRVQSGRPRLDATNRRFLWIIDMDLEGRGPVRGLVVGHFGRHSLVQVAFYCLRSEWDRYSGVGLAILNSFRFDSNTAYSVSAER